MRRRFEPRNSGSRVKYMLLLSPRQAPGTLKNGTEHGRGHERANDAETREASHVLGPRSPPSSRHSARPPIAESIITRPYHHLRTAFNGRHTISAQSRAPHGRRIQHCCVWSSCLSLSRTGHTHPDSVWTSRRNSSRVFRRVASSLLASMEGAAA